MEITAAEALVKCLELEGVELVFGYPGGAILPVYDALSKSTKVKHILVRHEQGATHAASGYARATGRVGVCMSTSGPGATNLVTGIANAYMDSLPMVVFTGQVPTNQVGTDAFQEVDITGISMPIVKHSYLLKDPGELPAVIKKAFHIAATGRPGPVLIDLPKDVTQAVIDFDYPQTVDIKGYKPTYRGHPAQVMHAGKMIMEAERPVIVIGGGAVNAEAADEIKILAETTGAPVVCTLMGLGAFPADHPQYLGMLGLHGARYVNLAVANSDLLITLGARFDDRVTSRIAGFAPNAKVIHIDIDPAEIGKNVISHLPIVGDVRQVLQALILTLDKKENPEWAAQIKTWRKLYPLSYVQQENGRLKGPYVIEQIAALADEQTIIATDVGQHQMWTAQFYPFRRPRTFITSGGLGCMGFGLPGAIGAQLGCPGVKTVLITGDGSFQMTMTELATAVDQRLPLKIVVLNNHCLGMVRQLQEFYCDKRYTAVNFSFVPDFAALAGVYGFKTYTVKNQAELDATLPEFLEQPGPALINCLTDPEENVLPMVMAGEDIGGPVE